MPRIIGTTNKPQKADKITIFKSSGTFVPTSTKADILVVAGGGAGGHDLAGGGGAGGYRFF